MKVTCGACWGPLKVDARLADSDARCPKCHELIRIPLRNSPVGANAVVVSDADEDELVMRHTGVEPAVGQIPRPGPKTEPLPTKFNRPAGHLADRFGGSRRRGVRRPSLHYLPQAS